jgi:RNA polymerase sigma-70 factor (ECF subfamily)
MTDLSHFIHIRNSIPMRPPTTAVHEKGYKKSSKNFWKIFFRRTSSFWNPETTATMPKEFQPLKADDLCRLIDAHGATLILYARQWNAADAEDIVQEAFLRRVRRATWEGKPDNPIAWLFTAVRNEAIDRLRKAKRRQHHEQRAAAERPIEFTSPPDASLHSAELLEHLDTLPPEQREVVVARIWGGLTFDEIAALVGDSRTTVYRRYGEALDILRQKLS